MSLLDDENILTANLNKLADNPIYKLYSILTENSSDFTRLESDILDLLKMLELPSISELEKPYIAEYEWVVYDNLISYMRTEYSFGDTRSIKSLINIYLSGVEMVLFIHRDFSNNGVKLFAKKYHMNNFGNTGTGKYTYLSL